MAEMDRPEPGPKDVFEQFVNEHLWDEIDHLPSSPAENPQVEAKETSETRARWKKPDKDDIRYFGGFLYSWGLETYKLEAILDTQDTIKSNRVKAKLLDLTKQIMDPWVKHYTPSGAALKATQITIIDSTCLKDADGNRTRNGIVFGRHPNISKSAFQITLNKLLERVNKDLEFIGEHQIPPYAASTHD